MDLSKLTSMFRAFLAPGPVVFMPIVVLIFALFIRAYDKKSLTWFEAIKAAVMLGLAFEAIFLVIGYIIGSFTGPLSKLQVFLKFNSIDVGWAPIAALSWAWPFSFLLIPIQVFTNFVMLKFKWTKTLNVDIWNVWHRAFTAMIVTIVLAPVVGQVMALVVGLFAGLIMTVVILKMGDVLYEKQLRVHKIPSINSPHCVFLLAPFMDFIDRILMKFKFFRAEQDIAKKSTWTKVAGEPMFAGFMVGTTVLIIMAIIDRPNLSSYASLPFKIAAALTLFPFAAKLLLESLTPIGTAVQDIMTEKFKGRELYIGLDLPIVAGNPQFWLVGTMIVPITLVYALIFSNIPGFKAAFPLAGMINFALLPGLVVICNKNVRRMLGVAIFIIPLTVVFASIIAPMMSTQALSNPNIIQSAGLSQDVVGKLGKEIFITSYTEGAPAFKLAMLGLANVVLLFTGKFSKQTIVLAAWFVIWMFIYIKYYKIAKNSNEKLRIDRLAKAK